MCRDELPCSMMYLPIFRWYCLQSTCYTLFAEWILNILPVLNKRKAGIQINCYFDLYLPRTTLSHYYPLWPLSFLSSRSTPSHTRYRNRFLFVASRLLSLMPLAHFLFLILLFPPMFGSLIRSLFFICWSATSFSFRLSITPALNEADMCRKCSMCR